MHRITYSFLTVIFLCASVLTAAPLRVVTTTTDLASIVRAIGGDQVEVKSLANGIEDPHFIEARPGFIRDLARADVFVQIGMDLEVGWVPVLLQQCRNRKVLPGESGFIDASSVIHRIYDRVGDINRAMGDVHANGNPHYLVDPAAGILVTEYIGRRLARIAPDRKDVFARSSRAYQNKLAAGLWGPTLTNKYPPVKLAGLLQKGGADAFFAFLKRQGQEQAVGGWMGRMRAYRGKSIVVEHMFWPYFVKTFGLKIVGAMEPIPGVDPTTRHLKKVIDTAKAGRTRAILALPYFPSRHARFVAQSTGANIARMAHMPGARPGTDDYHTMLEHNIRELTTAFGN